MRRRPVAAGGRGAAQGGRQPVVQWWPVRGRVPPVQRGRAAGAVRAGRERRVRRRHPGPAVRVRVQQHGRVSAAHGQLRARGATVLQGAGRRAGQRQGDGAPVPRVRRAQVVRQRGGGRATRAAIRAEERGGQAMPASGRSRHSGAGRQLSAHGQEDVRLISAS